MSTLTGLRSHDQGFTLVELLVVILILALLLLVGLPAFLGQQEKVHDSAAMRMLRHAYLAAKTDLIGQPLPGKPAVAQAITKNEPSLGAAPVDSVEEVAEGVIGVLVSSDPSLRLITRSRSGKVCELEADRSHVVYLGCSETEDQGDDEPELQQTFAQAVQSLGGLRWYFRFEEGANGPFASAGGASVSAAPDQFSSSLNKIQSSNEQLGEAIATDGESILWAEPDPRPDVPAGNGLSIGLWAKIPQEGGILIEDQAIYEHHENPNLPGMDSSHILTLGDLGDDWGVSGITAMARAGYEYEESVEFSPDLLHGNSWTFYGVSFAGDRVAIYRNGAKTAEGSLDAEIDPGHRLASVIIMLMGSAAVDEAFATGQALSEQQWAELYAAATAG
mgnify:FL=1